MKKTITISILLLVFSFLFFNSYGQKETKPKPETKEKQKQAKDSFGPTYKNPYAKKSDSFGPTYKRKYANNPDNIGKQTLEIKPYAGFSQPVGSYSGFSKTGTVVGFSADYFITPNFGLGMDLNTQFNGFKHPFDFSRIPETIQAANQDTSGNIFYETEPINLFETQNGSWTTTTFSFGPTYRMNYKKISSDLYAKVGVSFLSTPEARTYHEYDTYETDLFRLNKQNSVSFGLTSGARFYYHINKMFSVYVNPQVVFTAAKVNYSYVDDLDPAFNTGRPTVDSISGFDRDAVALGVLESQNASFNPVHFNLNAGLSINIGIKPKQKQIKDSFGPTYRQNYKKKSSINNEEREEDKEVGSFGPTYRQNYKKSINNEDNCQACILSKTNNQKDYALDQKDRPDFNWENNPKNQDKPDKYILRLSNEKGEILYTEETKKTSSKHNQELESVYQNYASDKKKKIYWDVESQSEECGSQTSERNSFSLKSGSTGLDIDLNNVNCESPAFNDDGTVSYTAEILFTNSVNNDNSITILQQTFTFTNTNGTEISNATETNCSGNTIAQLPFTLAPGTSQTVCVEFKRPFGENATVVNADYVQTDMPNITMNEIDSEDLPSCICNVCEDWKFGTTNVKVQALAPNSNQLEILTDIRIQNSELIQEVDAEIVSVQHLVNEDQCYSCTKKESEMALFTKGKISPRSYWENNGSGRTYERNADNVGNILSWKAKSPGVDFTMAKRFHLSVTIPERSGLDCCNSLYTICVRYTFTNINCETCTYVKCYEINLDKIEELEPGRVRTIGEGELQAPVQMTRP